MADMNFMNQFDVIYSNAALHWVKDHSRLLNQSYSALKPGGKILWNFAGEGNCSDFFEIIRNMIQTEPYKKYFQSFQWPWYMPSKFEYEGLMNLTEFKNIVVTEENADRFFTDAEEMIGWIDQPFYAVCTRRIKRSIPKRGYRRYTEKSHTAGRHMLSAISEIKSQRSQIKRSF